MFDIIYFWINKSVVPKWKHGIGHSCIIIFNKYLEIILSSIIELVNIDGYSYEGRIVNFRIKKYLNKTQNSCATEDDDGNCFELSYSEIYIEL